MRKGKQCAYKNKLHILKKLGHVSTCIVMHSTVVQNDKTIDAKRKNGLQQSECNTHLICLTLAFH